MVRADGWLARSEDAVGASATLYQFGSVLGIGYRYAGGSDLSLRAEHVSNAGIRFVQLRYQYGY